MHGATALEPTLSNGSVLSTQVARPGQAIAQPKWATCSVGDGPTGSRMV
jgi:hypothetical protein